MNNRPEKRNVLLNSQNEQPKTEITDTTDYPEISNDDFINGIFGELKLERPITVSFKGNPATVKNSAWFGQAYIKGKTTLPSDANNYVSFAIFTPNNEGQYRRKKAQFAALYAIMLDPGSRYFCESFYGHPCPTSGKNYATAHACGGPSRPASFVGYPTRGIQHHSRNDSTRCRKACIFTTQKDAS